MTDPGRVRTSRLPEGAGEKILYLAVVFVPFQQALTIPIGFPLKISEVCGILGILLLVVEGRRAAHSFRSPLKLLLFGVLVATSSAYNLLAGEPRGPAPAYDLGLTNDLIQYFGYAIVVLIVCWFTGTRLGPEWLARGLLVAVKLAATYCVAQIALWSIGQHAVLASLNGRIQAGAAYGINLPRNGPFLEGNYLGFFAGIVIFIAAKKRDRWALAAGIFCLLYSESTTGLISVLIAILFLAVTRPTGKVTTFISSLALPALLAVMFIPAANTYVTRQLGKLGIGDTSQFGSNIGYSLRSRTVNIESGFNMAASNPGFGVGPGRYGYWYPYFTDYTGLPSNFNAGIERPIANNAFVQIFSELGIIAGVVFVLILLSILWALKKSYRSDLALVAVLIIGLNATPAWTVLPIWLAIAYLSTVPVEDIRTLETERRHKRLRNRTIVIGTTHDTLLGAHPRASK